MSRTAIVLAALAVASGPAQAQGVLTRSTEELRALQLRLTPPRPDSEAFLRESKARDADSVRIAGQRRGRVIREGAYAVIAPQAMSSQLARQAVRQADSLARSFPVVPEAFTRATVVFIPQTHDVNQVIRQAGLAPTRVVQADWSRWTDSSTAAGNPVGLAVTKAYQETLDPLWRTWLPDDLTVGWRSLQYEWAVRELSTPRYRVGSECLEGRAEGCRLLFALDVLEEPMSQYSHAERRQFVMERMLGSPDERTACGEGNDESCLRILVSSRHRLPDMPSSPWIRGAFARAMQETYGIEMVHRALADREGSPGERFARAAGTSVDAVALAGRHWILSRGRADRVTASSTELTSSLVFILIMIGLATRSGRWR